MTAGIKQTDVLIQGGAASLFKKTRERNKRVFVYQSKKGWN